MDYQTVIDFGEKVDILTIEIENINSTLTLFSCKNKNEKIESLKKNFVQKCIQWCEKYNIPYNKILTNHNIFLNDP